MTLINGDELSPKPQTDNRHVESIFGHAESSPGTACRIQSPGYYGPVRSKFQCRAQSMPGLWSISDGVQRTKAAQVEPSVCGGRRRGEIVVERVGAEQLELAAGLDDARRSAARDQINSPRSQNRRGSIAIAGQTVQVDLVARSGVEALQHAVIPQQIDELAFQQGRGDFRRSPVQSPQFERAPRFDEPPRPRFNGDDDASPGRGNQKHFPRSHRRRYEL